MSLTPNQQRSLQGLSGQSRQRLIATYRRQNSQSVRYVPDVTLRRPFIAQQRGFQPTMVAIPRQQSGSGRNTTRPPANNNINRSYQGNGLLRQPLPSNTPQETGTCIVHSVESQADTFLTYGAAVHPENIPAVATLMYLYGEWSFMGLSYRFVSTSASTVSGTSAICFQEQNNSTPTRMSQLLRQPGIKVTRAYENSDWIIIPPNKGTVWYSCQGTTTQQPFNRQPGWLMFGWQSNARGTVGHIEVRYNIKFRLKRRFPRGVSSGVQLVHTQPGDDDDNGPPFIYEDDRFNVESEDAEEHDESNEKSETQSSSYRDSLSSVIEIGKSTMKKYVSP